MKTRALPEVGECTDEMAHAMSRLDGYDHDRDMPTLQRWKDYWDAAAMAAPLAGDGARDIHGALTTADLEYSAYSCNGVNLFGDHKSIKAAVRAFHSHSQIDDLQRNLRHWRDECGKLHSQIAALRSARSLALDALAQFAKEENWTQGRRFDPNSARFDGASFAKRSWDHLCDTISKAGVAEQSGAGAPETSEEDEEILAPNEASDRVGSVGFRIRWRGLMNLERTGRRWVIRLALVAAIALAAWAMGWGPK